MKLTPENAYYMDCRPPQGEANLELAPEHLRARMEERRAARAARAAAERPAGEPGAVKVKPTG